MALFHESRYTGQASDAEVLWIFIVFVIIIVLWNAPAVWQAIMNTVKILGVLLG